MVGTADEQPSEPSTSLIISPRNRPGFVVDVIHSVLDGEDVPTEIVVVDQSGVRNPELASWADTGRSAVRYLWSPERDLDLVEPAFDPEIVELEASGFGVTPGAGYAR